MVSLIKMIITIMLAVSMQGNISEATEVTPQQAAQDFMSGMVTLQEESLDRYGDNAYVNFLANVSGDEKTVLRMQDALTRNLTFEIEDTEERNDLAVAKVRCSNCDFSGVLEDYEEESYIYVTENLYDEDVTDPDKLAEHCLDMYVSEIETRANKGKTKEFTIYLPMKSNGYNGWTVMLSDEIMADLLGHLAIPESVIPKTKS